MSYNVINQVVSGSGNTQIIRLVMKDNGTTSQTQTGKTQIIKQIVQSGERGPKGDPGKDGAIHYTAGPGIAISDENRISVTGGQVAVWGAIDGNLADQTDLKNVLNAYYLSKLVGGNFFGNYRLTMTSKNILSGTTATTMFDLPNASASQNGLLKSSDFNTFNTVTDKLSYSKLTTDSTLSKTTSGSGTNTAIQLGVASSGVNTAQLADEAVTTAKIDDGAVTASKIDFSTLGGNYSTTEADTNYTWIDGKHIYKKTVDFGSLPNTTNKSVAHGISNMAYVVKYEGMITYSNDNIFRQIPHISPATITDQVLFEIDPTNITAYTGTDRSNFSAYVTIYYTKTS